MKISKRQLRRIIREEKQRLLEQTSPYAGKGNEVYSALEDVFMMFAPDDDGAGYTSVQDFMAFKQSVMDGLKELEDRVVDPNLSQADRMGMERVTIGRPR